MTTWALLAIFTIGTTMPVHILVEKIPTKEACNQLAVKLGETFDSNVQFQCQPMKDDK